MLTDPPLIRPGCPALGADQKTGPVVEASFVVRTMGPFAARVCAIDGKPWQIQFESTRNNPVAHRSLDRGERGIQVDVGKVDNATRVARAFQDFADG